MDLEVTKRNRQLVGTDVVQVEERQSLVIETSPGGKEILDEEVPAGKVWEAKVWVEITEHDA